MDAKERERAEISTQTYAALGVGFVCIIVGLPLWWKTTEVYRVQLPYTEIGSLATSHVKYNVHFGVVLLEENLNQKDLSIFGEKLKRQFENTEQANEGLSSGYRGNIRHCSDLESNGYKKATTIQELDNLLNSDEAGMPDVYQLYILPQNTHLKISKPFIGRYRNVYLPFKQDFTSLIPVISSIVRETLVGEAAINKAFYTAKGAVLSQADKESMRSFRLYPGYEVTYTLLNPQPDVVLAQWDIRRAIAEYMQPLLEAFSSYAEINVKSQYLHYAGLGVQPTRDEKSGEYKLTEDQLPHIINPIEAHLSSHVSTNPNLNFVLYVTPRSHFPLQIYDSSGAPSSSNSFLSPRWGGIMVYNTPIPENASLPAPVDIDMQSVMEVFLYQMRLLLGVNPQVGNVDVDIAQPGRGVISKWELDQWLRLRALENLGTSMATLKSLAQLLEEIGNIVINDDIGREVERAVSSMYKAKDHLKLAKNRDAFVYARQALLSSETAFFDPSLLELLYFPEDQKFAIYIPLFLPISIPVVMSVMQAIKTLRNKDKAKKE